MTAKDVLQREFLEIRAKLLEVAAAFDRLDRAEGDVADDPRLAKIRRALVLLQETEPTRAEQMQLLFSRAYDQEWQRDFGFSTRS